GLPWMPAEMTPTRYTLPAASAAADGCAPARAAVAAANTSRRLGPRGSMGLLPSSTCPVWVSGLPALPLTGRPRGRLGDALGHGSEPRRGSRIEPRLDSGAASEGWPMRYFTAERILRLRDRSQEQALLAALEDWERALAEYQERWRQVRPEAPADLRQL